VAASADLSSSRIRQRSTAFGGHARRRAAAPDLRNILSSLSAASSAVGSVNTAMPYFVTAVGALRHGC
jgi:hypothetical protein